MKNLLVITFFFPLALFSQTYAPTDTVYFGPGEYAVGAVHTFLYGISGNTDLMGTNLTGTGGLPGHCVTSPTNQPFISAWGALHGFYGIGTDGFIRVVGDNSDGQYGDGTSTGTNGSYEILVDSAGNSFGNQVAVAAFFTGNAHNGALSIKSDGTLWVWGNLTDNMRGNGTGGSTFMKPVQILIPGGRQAIQVLAGFIAMVLCSDGTVWSFGSGAGTYASLGYAGTGSQWATIHQVTGLTGITQIAGGEHWNYGYNPTTNKLYRWGFCGNYMGKAGGGTSGPGLSISLPEEATELETGLNMPTLSIRKIITNSDATFVIMSDGTLHGWGDNVQGGVGIGSETNWTTYATPYANNLGTFGQLLQITPVQIGYKTDWKTFYASSVFNYMIYAIDAGGNTYTWGRNKGAVTQPFQLATSDLNNNYPNSLDVLSPTLYTPYANTRVFLTTSPWCITHSTASACSEFNHGPYSALSPSAGANQSITSNTTALAGVVGDTTLSVLWSVISGPGSPHLISNTDRAPTLNNLSVGTTTLQFTAINNGFTSYSSTMTVTVTSANPCNCSIQLPQPPNAH